MADVEMESIEAFAERSRDWIEQNLPTPDQPQLTSNEHQALLYDAGFAGIAFPKEYGGAGLTLDHQMAFHAALRASGRVGPFVKNGLWMVSLGMIGPTILDHGSDEAKKRFLPSLLRGDTLWMQLLSEPGGGSDMAGAMTRLTRDGDSYVLNGAKTWSSGAYLADYALCLCRTDWDLPKHRGLSMVAVPLQDTSGVELRRIRVANGEMGEFCEEFFTDVALPVANLIGPENSGWSVAQGLLGHERNAVGNIGHGHLDPRGSGGTDQPDEIASDQLSQYLAARGRTDDPVLRQLAADAFVQETVDKLASKRVMLGLNAGKLQGQWGSLLSLGGKLTYPKNAKAKLVASAADGVVFDSDDVALDSPGIAWLGARGRTLAGGTTEMQRNIVSERLLGLPREPAPDRGLPFNEVIRTQSK